MIKELKIENLAIIKNMQLTLKTNFIVLTGETGAGKSIILDGLSLLLGSRGNTQSIRKGEDSIYSEAVINLNNTQYDKLNNLGYELNDNELIISRTFDNKSGSKVLINGKRSKVSILYDMMKNIVDLVGQHDHQYLLNSQYHLELFDKFLNLEAKNLKKELENILQEYRKVSKKILLLNKELQEIQAKKDLYTFQIEEFEEVNPEENEDENLHMKYDKLNNLIKINKSANSILEDIKYSDSNILSFLNSIKTNITYLSEYGNKYEEYIEKIENFEEEMLNLLNEVEYEKEDISEEDIDDILVRMDNINKLKKKYGPSLGEVISNYKKIKKELEDLDDKDLELESLKDKKNEIISKYKQISIKLSKERKKVALDLEKSVDKEFNDLNMKTASFKVNFSINNTINANGIDNIEFLIRTNIGQDYKSLSKTASGGELSRIMLALKIIFSKVDDIGILIFDEIDTGISGQTVSVVAQKMKELSKLKQIICVTHSPQIAAFADTQLFIYKEIVNDKTQTNVRELNYEQRVQEIARIISGDKITNSSLEYAREMIASGQVK